jgi:hypothetical protein
MRMLSSVTSAFATRRHETFTDFGRSAGMMEVTMSQTPQDTTEQVRQLANELWEEAGQPEGRSEYFWHMAERQVQERLRGYDKTLADTFPASDAPANSGITGPHEDAKREGIS